MGNTTSLVINNTTQDITIKECKAMYCKGLKKLLDCPTDKEKHLRPGEHACYSPSKLEKSWKMRQRLMCISSKIWVSFKGNNNNEGVELSVTEFKSNAGIVLNIGENNQLVKALVSREEAKKTKQSKSSGKHEEKLKQHLISIVEKRNTASTSSAQQGEGENLTRMLQDDVED